MKLILLFGDSLTQFGHGCERAISGGSPGWGDRLGEIYTRRADVLNRGCTMYNTRTALSTNLIPLIEPTPRHRRRVILATIWFGANDSCDALVEPKKHVSLLDFESNLKEIINRVLKFTDRIILISPTPINESIYKTWRGSLQQDRFNLTIQEYSKKCLLVSKQFPQVQFLDLFKEFQQQENSNLISPVDGLHLSDQGDEFVFKLISSLIKSAYPELEVTPDPITNNYANSASNCLELKPSLLFWDKIDSRNHRKQLIEKEEEEEDDDDDDDGISFEYPNRSSIVLIGDSITQFGLHSPLWTNNNTPGWGDYLAARYSRRCDVYNRGLAGYNTRWALTSFDHLFLPSAQRKFPIELITIFFGANDASIDPKQHVPLIEFESNVIELIKRCKNELNCRRIVLIGCPPIDKDKYLAWKRNRKGNENKTQEELLDRCVETAFQYSTIMENIGLKLKLPFIDLFKTFGNTAIHAADCLIDGLHLNGKGNKLLAQKLIKCLDEKYPEIKCMPDGERNLYGFYGSQCRAFPPEQPWFQDIEVVNLEKRIKL